MDMARRDCLFSVCFLSTMGIAFLAILWWWATHFAGPFIPDDLDGIQRLLCEGVTNEDVIHLLRGEQTEKVGMDVLLKLEEQTVLHIISRNARYLSRPQRERLWRLAEGKTVDSDYEHSIKCNIARLGVLSEDEVRVILSVKQDKALLEALLKNNALTPQAKAIVELALSPSLRMELSPTNTVEMIKESK